MNREVEGFPVPEFPVVHSLTIRLNDTLPSDPSREIWIRSPAARRVVLVIRRAESASRTAHRYYVIRATRRALDPW